MYQLKAITVRFYFDYNLGISKIEDMVAYKLPKFLISKQTRAEACALALLHLQKNIPKTKVITGGDMKKATLYDWLCYKKDFLAHLSVILNALPSSIEGEDFALMYLILIQYSARNAREVDEKVKIPDYRATYGDH